ncbi:type II toxin-antitoxin system VapC family toxin (plasmid) [Arsenophonus nasoniae]|uniref:Ribonuclease VapC n=1 Tax=Arsenophonus nasoniae TaxID=638 RepID=A0A4P7L2E3_9GAMM|nr:type II toxin-antitoxin system VapC family toxin [Arsenophonus nasoniae]QBY46566.1 tRNA(fMet)-specific endonuclease VapC [Arsenophonus nasoniae]WGM08421.1 type II toxin-antitoxin system VapC family toxin [Arsenophonus nasoniae]WGM13285.1 type II toxin-antitoxin system VapC family toxin [Arsenophonus nasoniae]WGM17927.1 type II toxin-antitoxin system VapC family toxin [Arsenophonus nasoniae]
MIKYLLDTNIVIFTIKRKPVSLLPKFNQHTNQLAISAITFAELIFGAEKSMNSAKNLATVNDFVSRLTVLPYDEQAAFHYGDIKANFEKKEKPIGDNDLHIAAHARSKGLVVVTNNTREFERVEGLRIEDWTQL